MEIELSNAIIKAYRKKDNKIAFHYRTDLLVKTKSTFGFSFEDRIKIYFTLPDKRNFEFDKIERNIEMLYPFNGNVMPLTLKCEKVIENIKLQSSIITIKINYDFEFSGYYDKSEIVCSGVLKKMFF